MLKYPPMNNDNNEHLSKAVGNDIQIRIQEILKGRFEGLTPTAPAFSFAMSDEITLREDLIDNTTNLRIIISHPKTTLSESTLDELGIDYLEKIESSDPANDMFRVSTGARSVRSVLPIISRDLESRRGLFYEIGSAIERLHEEMSGLPVTVTLDSFGFDTERIYFVPPYEGKPEVSLEQTIDFMAEQVFEHTDGYVAERIAEFIKCGAGLICEDEISG